MRIVSAMITSGKVDDITVDTTAFAQSIPSICDKDFTFGHVHGRFVPSGLVSVGRTAVAARARTKSGRYLPRHLRLAQM